MTTDPAVTAAAEAACDGSHGWTQPCSLCVEFAERAVPKVRPIIEAEVLARIAVEIEARIEPPDETPCVNGPGCPECIDGRALRDAVRIARGTA